MTRDEFRSKATAHLMPRPSEDAMRALEDAIARLNGDGNYIARALTESLLAERPIVDEPSLSPEEIDFLITSGEFTPEEFDDIELRVRRGSLPAIAANTLVAGLHRSMSDDAVRGFLDLNNQELDDLVTAGRLYAVDVAGHRRFPWWQFSLSSPGKVLPHLTEVIALLGKKHWISVSGLMSTPQDTMVIEGKHTPVEWFRAGGGIDALEAILEAQRWR
ncbi:MULTISPECIES: hypothetical protein [Microbacterium]|uniref:hypothetical protein n=1 Tax=Microbacterium TaxID=33882 RepID=UPI0013B41D86|nr:MULTISPECIES: hypothetical protein [Microbacterium]MCZ0710813.1 hypothetical protein [Microbacterium paraoxydans]MDH5131669.1 hypothetical protein [Microbacterium sp. RD10]MDH5135052.1 hypothetical protein [Microbacterium sp. RD11]MDH5144416.1 hypothetical protein [Microbacterium sp. RD12]MDH5153360.1 hypothetical protein [Microbacterium sp. RD06]